MSTYAVTFRIAEKTINGKSYHERRQQLVDNVRGKNTGFWDETTSFFLVESRLSTDAFTAQAVRGLSAREDMVVVFDPEDMSCGYFGAVEHPDVLRSFFRTFTKAVAA